MKMQQQMMQPPPVPLLTQQRFESLPRPGRYFLKIDSAHCPSKACTMLDSVWAIFAGSEMVATEEVYKVDCAGSNGDSKGGNNVDFCIQLLGFHKYSYINFQLVVVHLQPTGSSAPIVMEPYRGADVPMELMSWLKEAVSMSLTGDSLESMVEAYDDDTPGSTSSDKPEIALLMLSTDGLGLRPDIWCRFLDLGTEQGVNVRLFLHDKKAETLGGRNTRNRQQQLSTSYCPHQEANHRIHRVPTILTQWGTVSIPRATNSMLKAAVAKFGGAERYAIVSDSSVPLMDPKRMLEELRGPEYTTLSGAPVSVFQMLDDGRPSTLEWEQRFRNVRPRLRHPQQHQQNQQQQPPPPLELSPSDHYVAEVWWIMDEKAGAWFANNDYTHEYEMVTQADETYFVSLCKKFGLPFKLASAHRHGASTVAAAEPESHPIYTEWPKGPLASHANSIDTITKQSIARWGQRKKHSFLFARKITEHTTIDLPWMTISPSTARGDKLL